MRRLDCAWPDRKTMGTRMCCVDRGIDFSVLIPSCDKYSDLWTPFFILFWRHWPDCPFPVYLGSNEKTFSHTRVQPILVGPDRSWSDSVRKMLQAIDTPYVLMILEDFFLRRHIDTERILSCLDALCRLEGEMLRLIPRPGPDAAVRQFPEIGLIKAGAPFRVSTQAAIWRREFILALLRDGESIWQFEVNGTARSADIDDGFYCVWKPIMPYRHHVVERGKWFRREALRFRGMGIGCDFSGRPIMTRGESLRWNLGKMRSHLLKLLPWKQRLRFVEFVRRMKGKR